MSEERDVKTTTDRGVDAAPGGHDADRPAGPAPESAVGETFSDAPVAGERLLPASGHHEGPSFEAALEAVLLVADEPVPATTLAQVLARSVDDVQSTLQALSGGYVERRSGIDLRCVAGGWRLFTREDCAPYVERFVLDGQKARLTQAALETLAVVAYREPVTRSRVSAVRGVNVDGVVRTLVTRGLIAESGHDPSSGATLYSTTPLFLERLGIGSREALPSLAPLLPEVDQVEDDSFSS